MPEKPTAFVSMLPQACHLDLFGSTQARGTDTTSFALSQRNCCKNRAPTGMVGECGSTFRKG